jgi:hypothetical protein
MFALFKFKKNKKKKKKYNDLKPTYDNILDSIYTLNNRIKYDNYTPTDFDNSYLEENKQFLEVKKNDENVRYILFHKLLILIDYKQENKDIINNIDDMRFDLSNKLSGNMLPVYFQINHNLDTKDKLKDVIFNKIHYFNILLLNKLIIVNNIE